MNKVAIAYLTKDRVELSKRTIEPLLQHDKFDLHWFDGSATDEGRSYFVTEMLYERPSRNRISSYPNVRGGPDAAVAYALTALLHDKKNYTHIGLCENDVLLSAEWFDKTMELFNIGAKEGLNVGAVSPRAYEDRILFQRDGYAVMHNLGWGMQIMTREAAQLALANMRTGHTLENRRTFAQLTGLDIGAWWAFRAGEHNLCADWQNDKMLAAHGFASLALTPSPVEMIGQVPPLEEQGLKLVTEPVNALRNDKAFAVYREQMYGNIPYSLFMPEAAGAMTIFAHQLGAIGGTYYGDWKLKWSQGAGPFSWQADAVDECPTLTASISGPCQILVSGGKLGGQVLVEDLQSGYKNDPMLNPEEVQGIIGITVPSGVSYRDVRVTALSPGVIFYGIKVFEPQPIDRTWRFDHSVLPPV